MAKAKPEIEKRFVLDCSVTMTWLFADEQSEYGDKVAASLIESRPIVPPLWFYEVINCITVGERRRRIQQVQSLTFLRTISDLAIDVDSRVPHELLFSLTEFARISGLTSYDAAYLELANRLGTPLATLDKDLRDAAVKLGVSIYEPA